METREFWGRDMGEALQAVRASLGSDALILETLSVPASNSAEGGGGVKITAMRDEAGNEGGPAPERRRGPVKREERRPLPPTPYPLQSTPAMQDGRDGVGMGEVCQQLASLKSVLCWLIPGMHKGGVLEELVTQGVPPDLLARLVHGAKGGDGADEREQVRQALVRLIPTGEGVGAGGGQRECLALIGPPGAGKTSTLVKLTVRLARHGERRVGWVSLDNRRITGAEELTVYAGIAGVPCEVTEGREGLVGALERLSACDLVLIDTAGVSHKDDEGLAELAGLLQEIPHLKKTLVLDATTNGRDMHTWTKRYGSIGFDSLLFTKVDECGHFGPLINTLLACGRPLSYVASGQKVTGGLEAATPEALADLLLPEGKPVRSYEQ